MTRIEKLRKEHGDAYAAGFLSALEMAAQDVQQMRKGTFMVASSFADRPDDSEIARMLAEQIRMIANEDVGS